MVQRKSKPLLCFFFICYTKQGKLKLNRNHHFFSSEKHTNSIGNSKENEVNETEIHTITITGGGFLSIECTENSLSMGLLYDLTKVNVGFGLNSNSHFE